MTAKDIMDADYLCVDPNMPLKEAADLITEHHTLLLPVVDEECGAHGVLMEVDLLRAVLPKYLDSVASLNFLPDTCDLFDVDAKIATLKVKDVIADRKLYTVEEDTNVVEIAHIMLTKGISSVGVEREGRIVGVVTRGDLLTHIFHHTLCAEEQEES